MPDSTVTLKSAQSFYEKFKKSYLPSFDFFRLFFARLAIMGITIINNDKLYQFLQKIKNNPSCNSLLEDINFSFNGIDYISRDIDPNINRLQTLGALGIVNPKFKRIINSFSIASAKNIVAEYSAYNEKMDILISEFIKSQ